MSQSWCHSRSSLICDAFNPNRGAPGRELFRYRTVGVRAAPSARSHRMLRNATRTGSMEVLAQVYQRFG